MSAAVVDILDVPLQELPLVFFDVETTGLSSSGGDRICEIAMLRCMPGRTDEWLETLVDPDRSVSPASFLVNGITREMLLGAPPFAKLIPRIQDLFLGSVGVVHNMSFDVSFLTQEFQRARVPFQAPLCIDTLVLARTFFQFPRNNLGVIARTIGVEVGREHRARADVETMRAIFQYMTKELYRRGICTMREIATQKRKQARRNSSGPRGVRRTNKEDLS